ncbi:MAG: PEGA domain-containing protein [Planctomycetota bacterium]
MVTLLAVFVALTLVGGCRTHRILVVDSEPRGALVRFDGEVLGRTPLEHEFQHYGPRRLTLYLPGYGTWSERVYLKTPWYSYFPLDFLTEVLIPMGLTHRRSFHVELQPDVGDEGGTTPATDGFVRRAAAVRRAESEAHAGDTGETGDGDRP